MLGLNLFGPKRLQWLCLGLFTSLIFAASMSAAQEPVSTEVPLGNSVVFTLPAQWDEVERDDTREGEKGRLRVEYECLTDECVRTQETCVFFFRAKQVEGNSDTEALINLYANPYDRYQRMRSALVSTSKDATFLQQMERVKIGDRDWYLLETDARHNMKSGLYAETVINGRHLTVTCKTCEQGKNRHRQAREILATVRQN